MISVLMSIYNERIDWIKAAISSILTQTYSDFEFIIVVDNPNIDSAIRTVLDDYALKDSRIKIKYNERNIGLALSMNYAIGISNGKYIARMDADDISLPNRFEREISIMNERDVDFLSSNVIYIDEESNEIRKGEKIPEEPGMNIFFDNTIIHPTVMIKSDILKKIGGYRNFRKSQDFDLWLRLLSEGYTFYSTNEYLLQYRQRANALSCSGRLEQYYINYYQKQLFFERRKNGSDSFSEDSLSLYLRKKRITPRKNRKCIKCMTCLNISKKKLKNKDLLFVFYLIKAFVIFPSIVVNSLLFKFKHRRSKII